MLARILRAALLHEIAHVPLAEAPRGSGAHTLQVLWGSANGISVAAEPVGTLAKNGFPLRLRPLDPSHVAELKALLGDDGPSSSGAPPPLSASASAIFADNPPLPSGGSARPPLESITEQFTHSPPSSTDEHDKSVLFDPEQALIGRAPMRPLGTGAEDTLTVPLQAAPGAPARSSAPPPPPARASVGPTTGISHTAPMPTAPSPKGMVRPKVGSEVSISVDFDTTGTKSSAKALPRSEADEADPSLSESVVIDPDVLTRERRASGAPPPQAHDARSGADGESISVIFGDEKTSPNVDVPAVPVGVVVQRAVEEVAVATGRRPSVRRDPRVEEEDDEVDDDAATIMRPDSLPKTHTPDAVVDSRSMTSSRRSRTPKRTQVDVVAGRTIANKYRIQSLVGAGAVGAVYKGTHAELERSVAIKVLHAHYRQDPHLMQQFRSEARSASLLHHPNVTIVHDFGEEPDGLVYIVMEYLQGWTLQTVLDEERRLPLRRVVAIMLQVCGALAAAHERGIVHRDVKPDNIILVPSRDDDGRPAEIVKVCDFGIAALESSTPTSEEYTAGTPEYMAPEQAAGRADARTDVYACGVLLYEMLTGAAPFAADTAIAVLRKHAMEAPRPPTQLAPDIPPVVEAIILRALEKAPERRWQSARELRAELKRLLG
jgi:serine/threonine-protein kinase